MNETQSNPASFDPVKAARLRSQTLETFQAKGRFVTRYMYAWLVGCVAFSTVALSLCIKSTDPQSWFVYGVAFLLGMETSVLMKLWYWVVSSKLGILREVKLLRMDLAVQRGSMDVLEELARTDAAGVRTQGVPRWEGMLWAAAIFIVAMLIGVVFAASRIDMRYFMITH